MGLAELRDTEKLKGRWRGVGEAARRGSEIGPETIGFGGGTACVVTVVHSYLSLYKDTEDDSRGNPSTVSPTRLNEAELHFFPALVNDC